MEETIIALYISGWNMSKEERTWET